MKANNLQKQAISTITLFSFTMGAVLPQNAIALNQQQFTQDLQYIVNASADLFVDNRSGFVDHIFEGASQADKDFLLGVLPEIKDLPKLEQNANRLSFGEGTEQVQLEIVSEAVGEVLIQGQRFKWNHDTSVKANYDRVMEILMAQEEVSFYESLASWIIPTAHAKKNDGKKKNFGKFLLIAGGIIGAIFLVSKMSNNKKETKTAEADAQARAQIAKAKEQTHQMVVAEKTERLRIERGLYDSDSGSGNSHSGDDAELL